MSEINTSQQVQQLTEAWAQAEKQGDYSFSEANLADDFRAIGPRGFVLNKTAWVERFKSGSLKYQSFSWDEIEVRIYGETAVVIGRQTQEAVYQQTQTMAGKFRVTLIWVKQAVGWQLVNLQLSPIVPMP